MKIDVGKLLRGEFPIVDIAGFGVQVKGNLFGGQIDAELIGGILKLDTLGNMIDVTDSTTHQTSYRSRPSRRSTGPRFRSAEEGSTYFHSAGSRSASRSGSP